MEKLFVYGTLQEPEVEKQVFGRVTELQNDALEGFKKGKIELHGKVYYIAVREPGSILAGNVIEVTPEELILIDKYETSAYRRISVKLLSGKLAWVYCQG